MLLSTEILNKVWLKWGSDNLHADDLRYDSVYDRVARRTINALKFEGWLFTQGATVQQVNHKRYLQFTDDQDATVFILKY